MFRPIQRALAALMLLVVLLPASVASAGVLEDRLAATRSKGKQVKRRMAVVDHRQEVIVRQVRVLNARIAELDRPIALLEAKVDGLEYRIERREDRITELKRDYVRQRREVARLGRELTAARNLLSSRVVAAYMTGDTGMLEQLAGAGSLRDLFEREEALGKVVGLDEEVISKITDTERAVRVKRARNHQVQRDIRADIASLEQDRATVNSERAELQVKRDEVAAARADRDAKLATLNSQERQLGSQLDDLEEDASAIKQAIETGTVTYSAQLGGISASGLIWPVGGPVVSPFGQRWGRAHEGIDIAISAGNPIHAAAGGVVTYASWMSGYGNMVIVQHAGSLSTGYAHQSQIATSVGQVVAQGQVIGFVGCTGHCYGDHVHFETRENGSAVDPLRYLS